jgi:trigger factor
MIGLELGEEKDIEVKFPDNYLVPDLAGQTAIFKVEIFEIIKE